MKASNAMMYKTEDEAIKYNGKLQQVKILIEELKKMGLNVDSAIKEVKNIEELVSNKVEKAYNTYDDSTSFLNSALNFDYTDAIKRIDILIELLNSEWKDYYVIINKCNEIRSSLNNVEEMDFDQVVDSLIGILEIMRASTTINFEIEKDIVNKLYELIYNVMKLELISNNSTKLLDSIKNNETDSIYIANILKREIVSLNNEEVNQMVSSLQSNGIDSRNLLDKQLLMLIGELNNPEMISKLIDEYKYNKERLDSTKTIKESLENKKERSIYNLENSEKAKENIQKRYKRKIINTTIRALLVSLCLAGASLVTRKYGIDTKYNTEVTTYDSTTDQTTVSEEYTTGEDNKVTITEYTPWRHPEFDDYDNYKRYIYTYEVPEYVYELCDNPKEMLDTKYTEQLIPIKEKEEKSKEKPKDFGAKDNRFIITKQTKDLSDSKTALNKMHTIIILVISLNIITLLEKLYMVFIDKDRLKRILEDKKYNLEEIEEAKKTINDSDELIQKYEKEKEELIELLAEELNVITKVSKTNPEVAKQLKKIKEKN